MYETLLGHGGKKPSARKEHMKKYFTTVEAFEAYIRRTGQNNDYEPCIYKGYHTVYFRSEREVILPEYLTERAYMLQMYDDYIDRMQLDPNFDKSFEDFLHYDCEINDYYHGLYAELQDQGYSECLNCTSHRKGCRGSYPCCDPGILSLDDILDLILTEGILITAKDFEDSKQ